MNPSLEILASGAGLAMQDAGRPGWKRFGLPPGGAMDAGSAAHANLLIGNAPTAPLLEMAFTGARLRALQKCEIAITGAEVECTHPLWKSIFVSPGEEITFTGLHSGVWSYLGIQGGFDAPRWFGSASVNPRAGLGGIFTVGTKLAAVPGERLSGVSGRFIVDPPSWRETPLLPVWPGPEWEKFPSAARDQFFAQTWTVSAQSDRSGYRLEGTPLKTASLQILSSPTALGVIQIPSGGQPIVLLRDGPTVGGYPRLAILDSSAISRFTQCAPGTAVQFRLIE